MKKINKEKYIGAILLFLLCAGYFFIYLNKIFPFQEGWYMNYDELIKYGKLPYKDFYYYLPPLDLLINHILLFFSNGYFIIYKLLRLCERILLIELMYFTLSRYFSPRFVWFACFIGGILGASQSFELMGDYNQTGQLLFVVLAYTSARFSECLNLKAQKKWLFISGFIIGLQFTLKQTYFLSAFIGYFLILTFICFIEKNKNYLIYCFHTALGISIPILTCLVWTFYHNCYAEFISQVYLTDAKGGLFDILFGSIAKLLKANFGYLCLALLIFTLLLFLRNCLKTDLNTWGNYYFILFALSIIANCGYLFYSCFTGIFIGYWSTRYIFLFILFSALFALLYALSDKIQEKYGKNLFQIFNICLILFSFITTCVAFVSNYNSIADWIYNNTSAFTFVHYGAPILLFFGSFIYIISLVVYCLKKERKLINVPILMILTSALSVCYASLMTAKDYIVSSTCWITAPIIITIVLSTKIKYSKFKDVCVILLCLVISSTCLSQKVMRAYSWWGWEDAPLFEKTYSVDIKQLKGYKFSEKEKRLYEKTIKVINSNTDKDSTILGFPHIVLFNVLTDHINIDWSVPVLFYDVCSDSYAKKAAGEIKDAPPDIILWCDMPGCMETHEQTFRDGKPLGQREIQKWFIDAKDSEYQLIGQIDNLFIYKLNNNGIKTGYTYIEDSERTNITASESE